MLEFIRLRWRQPGQARDCRLSCDGSFDEEHKTAMLADGRWRATAVPVNLLTHDYHISGLYSPVGSLSWAEIARQWEEAAADPDARYRRRRAGRSCRNRCPGLAAAWSRGWSSISSCPAIPPGYVHLPDTVSGEWIKQLVAKQQVIVRSRRGFAVCTEWRQLRPRNEALDCGINARAGVWVAGADRWSDNRWRALEESS